jgi:hypothetical protein
MALRAFLDFLCSLERAAMTGRIRQKHQIVAG